MVGYGVAGVAAALWLRQSGHVVEHFERRASLDAPGGGLLLQPPALRLLARLGIDAALVCSGAPVERIYAESLDGRRSLDIGYNEFGHRGGALGVERSTLMSLLSAADSERRNVKVEQRVSAVDAQAGLIVLGDGSREGPFDLIVAADGANSSLRQLQANLVRRDAIYPWAALVGVVEGATFGPDRSLQQYFGRTGHVSVWPVASGAGDCGGRSSIAVNLPRALLAGNDLLGEWRSRVVALRPALTPLLGRHVDASQLYCFGYRDVSMTRFHVGRLVFVGDAAHATSPQLGLGVTMALQDAWCLARCLDGRMPVELALARYDADRRPRTEVVRRLSRLATPLFQSPSPLLGFLRDRLALPLARITPIRRRLLHGFHDGAEADAVAR